jgi:sugar lactone lactonase YvrE
MLQGDDQLQDKQQYFWLHMSDIPNCSGAEDICYDVNGNLYIATNIGIQVADRSGRVRAILPLPTPCGPVQSICFGGKEHYLGLTEQARTALEELVSYVRDQKPLIATETR